MEKIYFLKQELGSALIVAIFVLLVLSLAGIMAMKTAIIETEISGNLRSYKEHFYKAESVVREMALSLRDTPDPTLSNLKKLILPNNSELSFLNAGNFGDADSVLSYRLDIANNSLNPEEEPDNTQGSSLKYSKVLVVDGGLAPGASMSIGFSQTPSSKHRFFIFANAKDDSALGRGVLIEIGYLRHIKY